MSLEHAMFMLIVMTPRRGLTHESLFTLTKALCHHLRADLRRKGPVFDLVITKPLPPLVRPGIIRWSQLLGRSGDDGTRPVASVVQEQTRVLP
jgi:hypothetical protein